MAAMFLRNKIQIIGPDCMLPLKAENWNENQKYE